jgi:SAM-dependent methyltransferase
MSVFGGYARYYDLLYRDKDYGAEAAYVAGLIRRFAPAAKSALELGCGTGGHAQALASHGLSIHGVDLSAEMLGQAEARHADPSAITFSQGDLRTVRLGRRFDAVIALFHVISYQQTNEDLAAAFTTVREHLAPGGVFIFDCWYGPGVLRDPPAVRIKRFAGETLEVTRLAEPVMHATRNLVDVNYQILLHDKQTGARDELTETHCMRYLFSPELELLLRLAGLTLRHSSAWMRDEPPSFGSWSACFVAE